MIIKKIKTHTSLVPAIVSMITRSGNQKHFRFEAFSWKDHTHQFGKYTL